MTYPDFTMIIIIIFFIISILSRSTVFNTVCTVHATDNILDILA